MEKFFEKQKQTFGNLIKDKLSNNSFGRKTNRAKVTFCISSNKKKKKKKRCFGKKSSFLLFQMSHNSMCERKCVCGIKRCNSLRKSYQNGGILLSRVISSANFVCQCTFCNTQFKGQLRRKKETLFVPTNCSPREIRFQGHSMKGQFLKRLAHK